MAEELAERISVVKARRAEVVVKLNLCLKAERKFADQQSYGIVLTSDIGYQSDA